LLEALTGRLARRTPRRRVRRPRRPAERRAVKTVLATVDLSRTLTRKRYRARLDRVQADLTRLSRRAAGKAVTSVLVFEGWDAAGKGGVIRRLTRAMDARDYRVVPVAAPTEEEAAHHYLWRFWRYLPRAGTMLIFDRSWYGRVLVERVEGFARGDEWRRAYDEINDFERQLVEHGVVVRKFWLHVDRQTQLARFREREHTPYKKYKITAEDYRNRERWEGYVEAIHEMVERTSTEHAPWTLVPANDKRWARVEVLDTVRRGLKRALRD
jgi:polyphosphate kinase 2 (PPK2 family)